MPSQSRKRHRERAVEDFLPPSVGKSRRALVSTGAIRSMAAFALAPPPAGAPPRACDSCSALTRSRDLYRYFGHAGWRDRVTAMP